MRPVQLHRRRGPPPGRRHRGRHPAGHARPAHQPPRALAPVQPRRRHPPQRPAPAAQPQGALPPAERALRRHPAGDRRAPRARAPRARAQQPVGRHPLRAQQPHLAAGAAARRQPPLREHPQHQHPGARRLQRLGQQPQRLHPEVALEIPERFLRRQQPALRCAPPAMRQPVLPPVAGARGQPVRRRARAGVLQEAEALRRGYRRHRRGRRGGGTTTPRRLRALRGAPPARSHPGGAQGRCYICGGPGERAGPACVRGERRHDVLVQGGPGRRHVRVGRRRCSGRGRAEPAGVRGEGRGVQLRPGGPAARVSGGAGQGRRRHVVQGGAGGRHHGGGEAAQGRGGGAARVRRAHGVAGKGGAPQRAPRSRVLLLQGREAPRLRLPPQRQPLRHATRKPGLRSDAAGLGGAHAVRAVRRSRAGAPAHGAQPCARQRQGLQRAAPPGPRRGRAVRLLPPPALRHVVDARRRVPRAGGGGHAPSLVQGRRVLARRAPAGASDRQVAVARVAGGRGHAGPAPVGAVRGARGVDRGGVRRGAGAAGRQRRGGDGGAAAGGHGVRGHRAGRAAGRPRRGPDDRGDQRRPRPDDDGRERGGPSRHVRGGAVEGHAAGRPDAVTRRCHLAGEEGKKRFARLKLHRFDVPVCRCLVLCFFSLSFFFVFLPRSFLCWIKLFFSPFMQVRKM